MADQILYPEVIDDTEISVSGSKNVVLNVNDSSDSNTSKASTIEDQSLPTKKIAFEVIGSVLNTKSRRILEPFGFTESGALQIGKYEAGVHGDIKISPKGIVARNSSGINTITIDGETGDAVFAGTIQSGTLIAGDVVVGDNSVRIDGENRRIITYDDNGSEAVSIDKSGIIVNNGKLSIKNNENTTIIDEVGINSNNVFPLNSVSGSPYTEINSSSYTTIGSDISISLTRQVKALVILSSVISSSQDTGGLDCSGRNILDIYSNIQGSLLNVFYDSFLIASTNVRENIISKTYSFSNIVSLNSGDHTINFRAKIDSIVNIKSNINSYSLSIILLGT